MKTKIFLLFLLGSGGCNQPAVRPLPVISRLAPAATETTEQQTASFTGLADLLAQAQRSNPGLAAREAAWMAAKSRIDQSRGYPDPTVGLAGFISPLETKNGPTQARLSLRQALPWPSELDAREDGATAMAAAEFCKWQDASLAVQEQLKHKWWELAFTHRAIDLVQQTLELVITTETSLHSKLEVGRTSFGNVIRIEVERAKLEDSLRRYQDRILPLRTQIHSLLGFSAQQAEWPIPSIASGTAPIALSSLPDTPISDHPQLLESAYRQVAAKSDLKLARKQAWPKMSVGLEWTVIGDGSAAVPDAGEDALAASINFSLPLHQHRYAGARREAESRMVQFVNQQRETELLLRAQLSEAVFQYRDADQRVVLYRDQLGPKTERGFEAALSAFESGGESFETLLDTLRLLLDFQVASARAETDRAQALAKLERLYGQPFSNLSTEVNRQDEKATAVPSEEK